jgi:transcriptional regulator with XRE-family HTH domain
MPAKWVAVPRLGHVRERKLLSQAELARVAQVSRNTVARIERGELAQYATVRKLAAALGVEPHELLAAEGPERGAGAPAPTARRDLPEWGRVRQWIDHRDAVGGQSRREELLSRLRSGD